jgi:hypothetical protein
MINKMKYIYFFIGVCIPFLSYSQDTIALTSTRYDAGLRMNPSIYEQFFDTIQADTKIAVLDFRNDLWFVKSGDVEGYISSGKIWKTGEMYKLLKQSDKERILKRYGEKIGEKINSNQVWIGMTKNMLLDSKGNPEEINSTKTEHTDLEQWIYSSHYIYLENGKVTAIQSI